MEEEKKRRRVGGLKMDGKKRRRKKKKKKKTTFQVSSNTLQQSKLHFFKFDIPNIHSGLFLLDVGDAVSPVLPLRAQVSVRKRHQPPAHGEQQPAADERRGEDDQREAPFQVDQRGEHVLQESALLANVFVRQVARAVLGDEARLVHAVPEHRLAVHPGGEPRQTELLRDDALPRQHLALLPLMVRMKTRLRCVFTHACPPAGGRSKTRRLVCFSARRLRSAPLRAGTVSSLLLT